MPNVKFTELKELASSDVCQQAEWVTQAWGEEHFGSEAEAKFVVAASPTAVLGLITELERLETDNAALRSMNAAKR